jgi:Zn-finger protein
MGDYTFCTEFCSPMVTASDFPTVKWSKDADGAPIGKCQSCGTIYNWRSVDFEV